METELEKNLAQIARDSAYMRGQWDATIPDIKRLLELHSGKIGMLENVQANMIGKAGIAGVLGGGVVGLVFTWIGKHLF